jgi:hypothetical protein
MIFRLLAIALLLTIIQTSFAQSTKEKAPVDLYLHLSGSMNAYKGDLSPTYKKWSSAFQIGVVGYRNRWLNPTANLSIGNLTGQNTEYDYLAPSPRTNTFFKTNFVQFSLGLRLNIIKNDYLTVYANPNVGIMRFTPRDIRNQKLAEQAETRALGETLPTTSLTFPVNLGIMYKFKASDVAIGAEAGLLNPMTDYLDNIAQLGNSQGNDNSLQFRISVYAPLTRVDAEQEKKKQEERKQRREEWLRKRGLLKENVEKNKKESTPKVKTEAKKLTPAQRKRQKAKEKAEREKKKKAEKKAKAQEKKKKELKNKKKKKP